MRKEKLSGLWNNVSNDGIRYLGGTDHKEGRRFSVFKNGFKDKDNDPDYILYELFEDEGVPEDILEE